MRKTQFAPGEYYHLCGRGVGKQKLFLDTRDYARFLFLILYFQSPTSIYNLSRLVTGFIKHGKFAVSKNNEEKIVAQREVALISFCLMPNHFHLIIREAHSGGSSRYMQKILMAYAKYFNAKYKKSGHVFQGPFRAIHIEDNEQLLYTSAYVHRNPRELSGWKNKEHTYPWSSFRDYLDENRWGDLLNVEDILSQYKDHAEYQESVDESGAKEKVGEIMIA